MNKVLVLSYEEQVAFDNVVVELTSQGYPTDIATQYAWDSYYAALRGAKQLETA